MALCLREVTLVAAIVLSGGAEAYNLKPGLWEMQTKMEAAGELGQAMAAMQKQLAALPEGQRKMMADMMAKQGVGIQGLDAGGVRVRHCLSAQMVAQDRLPFEKGEGCQRQLSKRSETQMQFTLSCSDPQAKGEGEVTFVSPTAYHSRFTLDLMHEGKQERLTGTSQSTWLSAECGDIKAVE